MAQDLEQTFELLSRTPVALDGLLRGLPSALITSNEGDDTWTAYDVMGHLAYGDRTDWPARARMILSVGETQTFPPFDRLGQRRESQGKSLEDLLETFAQLRSANVAEFRALRLTPEDLDRRGQHPVFGPVTLSQLLAAWVTHDLTHLHQLSRILAHQYREAVGPWSAFLGVLHCDGHSAP